MRPRDWFSVGIRLLGAWLYYRAVEHLMYCASWFFEIVPSMRLTERDEAGHATAYYLLHAAGFFALGTYFLVRAERLTRWTFNEPAPADADAPEID